MVLGVNKDGSGTEVVMFAAGSWICTSRTGFVVEPKNGIVHGCSDGTTCDSVFGWFLPRETLFKAAQGSWLPKSLTHRRTTLNPRMHPPFFSNPITIPNSLAIRSQHPRKPVAVLADLIAGIPGRGGRPWHSQGRGRTCLVSRFRRASIPARRVSR